MNTSKNTHHHGSNNMKFNGFAKSTNKPNAYGYTYDQEHFNIVDNTLNKLKQCSDLKSFIDICVENNKKLRKNGKKGIV